MNTFLIFLLVVFVGFVVFSLVRGVVAFLQTTKLDLESDGDHVARMQKRQNEMMFARIKWQALAVVVVAVLLILNN